MTKNHSSALDLLNDSTKWVVSSGALATMLWRHDAETMWCVTGSVVASLICKVGTLRVPSKGVREES